MRILVAEDERITRATLTRQLEAAGHTVVAAEDGEQAWEAFQQGGFDLVMTDWEMPRLSGLELIQRIRAIDSPSYVYILMLTGRTDKADIVNGIEAGADDFLTKPFDRGELRVRLLAGERIVRLERALSEQNVELRAASERMRADLQAAARVQRAMLPRAAIDTRAVRASWTYVPTDELAGDAIGFDLVDDRYLVAYIADVTGHGVPAALLAVRLMHAMEADKDPAAAGVSLRTPSSRIAELNRRFCGDTSGGRFLTMILCVVDTHEGALLFSRAGHPLPIIVRNGEQVAVDDAAGLPLGILDEEQYEDVAIPLEPGDRVCLYSDGFMEQTVKGGSEQYGEARLRDLLLRGGGRTGDELVADAVESLTAWAGGRSFIDDVSLVVVEWLGARPSP